MRIRALTVVDRLERDGRALVLVGAEVVLVSEVAAAILRAAHTWTDISRVTEEVVSEFGAPGGMGARERVSTAAEELEGHGLLEIRRDARHNRALQV